MVVNISINLNIWGDLPHPHIRQPERIVFCFTNGDKCLLFLHLAKMRKCYLPSSIILKQRLLVPLVKRNNVHPPINCTTSILFKWLYPNTRNIAICVTDTRGYCYSEQHPTNLPATHIHIHTWYIHVQDATWDELPSIL